VLILTASAARGATPEPGGVRVASVTAAEVRETNARVDGMLREGRLRAVRVDEDTLLPGHIHERLGQFHKGVPVLGGQLVRQLDASGEVVSVFGRVYEDVAVDTAAAITEAQARAVVQSRAGSDAVVRGGPELAVVPGEGKSYRLAYLLVAVAGADVRRYAVDARDGSVIFDHSVVLRQTPAIGSGRGVLNNNQKVSVAATGGQFVAIDLLRPARIVTYDLKFNPFRAEAIAFGGITPSAGDLAIDSDNNWTDGPTVDAHAYAGWVYDYFFKRFGRRSWDDRNGTIPQIVNPIRPQDIFTLFFRFEDFFANAFYCCQGLPVSVMVYGQGAPAGTLTAGEVKPFAGALDLVAHEITHGMTDYTSGLDSRFCFAGGLNEAFSDMMAVSADFLHRPATANYRLFEDVFPGGIRDMANPRLFGDPDHIAVASICEVHYLAGPPNQAFYLAIEGGTNRTSGIPVRGVGSANREQIERVFYRAFTFMLTPTADYIDAADATVFAARQLYGTGSSVERAVIEAWTAVLFL
jgi:Zn-dependent metalloprotease